MKPKNKFSIGIGIILLSVLAWQFWRQQDNSGELISKELCSSDFVAIDHSFDTILSYCLKSTMAEMGMEQSINLNGPYQKNHLNVYVINTDLLKTSGKIGPLTAEEFLGIAEGNFLALPPDIIVIDKHYLSYLILSCVNEITSHLQANELTEQKHFDTEIDRQQYWGTFSAIATLLGINNYKIYKAKDNSIVNIDSLANIILQTQSEISAQDTIDMQPVMEGFVSYLLPIVSHELAHIKYRSEGIHGWIDFEKIIRSQLSNSEEETKADELSYKTIKTYFEKNKTEIHALGLISFCRTMKNAVLTDVYTNFRGTDPSDFFVTLEQKSNLTKAELKLPYCSFERVSIAYENPLPPLTEDEFSDFQQKLIRSGSSASHRHLLQRCKYLVKIAQESLSNGYEIDLFNDYLDILTIDPSDQTAVKSLFKYKAPHYRTGISKAQLLGKKLGKFVIEKKAINYKNNNITILFLKSGLGYVELYGDDENLDRISFVRSTRNKAGQQDSTTIFDSGFYFAFLSHIFEDPNKGVIKLLAAHLTLRNKEGDRPTFFIYDKGNAIKFTSMNESFFIRVDVLSDKSEYDDFIPIK